MLIFWAVAALAFAVGEVVTLGFFALFLCLAAVGSAVAAGLGADLLVQGIVFAALSLGGVLLARPPLLRWVHYRRRGTGATLSGAEEMIGRTGLVTDPIKGPHQGGHVKIMGERWPAITADGSPVKEGAEVRVVEIRNSTLVVSTR
ncbi:MAG TPA: NfeD family protein [Candidatus Dormibacteraeota bacterium]|jgi:membrane protein implicated in regulation of membrane protease activity